MNVKVTYTVSYEEVPGLIDSLIAECRDHLREVQNFKFNTLNLKEAAAEIDRVQNKMQLVSRKMEDSLNMLIGYNSTQTEQQLSDLSEIPEEVPDG